MSERADGARAPAGPLRDLLVDQPFSQEREHPELGVGERAALGDRPRATGLDRWESHGPSTCFELRDTTAQLGDLFVQQRVLADGYVALR